MIQKQIAGQIPQLVFEMRQIDRLHFISVDARPHHMRVATTLFLMHHNCTGLIRQSQLLFRAVCYLKEVVLGSDVICWWVQTEGEHKLLTLCGLGNCVHLGERTMKLIA